MLEIYDMFTILGTKDLLNHYLVPAFSRGINQTTNSEISHKCAPTILPYLCDPHLTTTIHQEYR